MAYSNNSGVTTASEYTRSYTTFSGCDIVATFGSEVVAEIQGITVSINREKAPVNVQAVLIRNDKVINAELSGKAKYFIKYMLIRTEGLTKLGQGQRIDGEKISTRPHYDNYRLSSIRSQYCLTLNEGKNLCQSGSE